MYYTFQNMQGKNFYFNGDNLKIYESLDLNSINEEPRSIDYFRNDYFSYLTIVMCNNCNLTCSYCYERQDNDNNPNCQISLPQARKAIDTLMKSINMHEYKKGGINFFGGEPLLCFDYIKELVLYSEEIKDPKVSIQYSMVTNGTLLTEEKIEFLEKYNFLITISIDGDQDTHDKERKFKNGKGSYLIVASNIKNCISRLKLKARITINNNNYDVLKAVESIRSLGINDIVIGMDENISPKRLTDFLKQYELLLGSYLKSIENKDYYCIDNIVLLLIKIFFGRRVSSKCNAGRSYFTLSADGDLYSCHRLIGTTCGKVCSSCDDFFDFTEEYSIKTASFRTKRREKKSIPCSGCVFINLCGGSCLHSSYLNSENLMGYSYKACVLSKFEIDKCLSLITSLDQENRRSYIEYLFN